MRTCVFARIVSLVLVPQVLVLSIGSLFQIWFGGGLSGLRALFVQPTDQLPGKASGIPTNKETYISSNSKTKLQTNYVPVFTFQIFYSLLPSICFYCVIAGKLKDIQVIYN